MQMFYFSTFPLRLFAFLLCVTWDGARNEIIFSNSIWLYKYFIFLWISYFELPPLLLSLILNGRHKRRIFSNSIWLYKYFISLKFVITIKKYHTLISKFIFKQCLLVRISYLLFTIFYLDNISNFFISSLSFISQTFLSPALNRKYEEIIFTSTIYL